MAKKATKKEVVEEVKQAEPIQPPTRNNSALFTEDALYNGLVKSLQDKLVPGKKPTDCVGWLGSTYPGKQGVQNIIKHGSYAMMNAQKLLWIVSRNLRKEAGTRGSVAIPRVTTNCGNPVCMNALHLIEKAGAPKVEVKAAEPEVKAEVKKPAAKKATKRTAKKAAHATA